jgi:PAS domain S-box-containing protein
MGSHPKSESHRRIGEILVEDGLVRPDKVGEALKKQKRLGQLLVEEGLISLEELCLALQKQNEELGRAAKVFDDTSRYLQDAPIFNDCLDKVMGSMTDVLIHLGPDATVRTVNPAALKLLGYDGSELVGHPARKIISIREDSLGDITGLESFNNVEAELVKKDGGTVPVFLSGSVMLDEMGRSQGVSCIAKDMTERKLAEEAFHKTNVELKRQIEFINKAQQHLIHAEKLASVGLLTADVSHEILNPLNIITMRIQMMIDDPATPPEIAHHLMTLDEQASRIAKISQDLLSFARRRPPERRRVDLNALAKRTLDLLEHKFRKEEILLELEMAAMLPQVRVDEDQLQQVVFNLLTNARDAMPQGGLLKLTTQAVRAGSSHWVEVRVEDSGEGIVPGNLDKLFQPFFTTKPEGEGTGLGLSISQNIVKAHGGSIWAEESPRGGAAFVVRLAVEEPWVARKILVVDDEPLICELLQEFLAERGYRAIIANSGEEALELYKLDRPDMVLLDVLLPGKNGLEVLKEIKAFDPKAAVFIITAVREEEVHKQAKAEGILDLITKPIDKDHLALALKTNTTISNRVN